MRRADPEGRVAPLAHLRELRRRSVLACAGVLAGAVVGWLVYDPLLRLLLEPLTRAGQVNHATITLNFTTVASSFDLKLQVSAFLGVVISCPCWMYQLWAFVRPALKRREKWYSLGFLAASVPLFLGGAYLAWWVLPNAVELLTQFTPVDAVSFIDAQTYLGFVIRLILAFALAFLVPVLMVALNLTGVVSAASWSRGWRWAVFVAFVFAAIASPTPDVLTMFFLAGPICALYGLAVAIAFWHDRRARRIADGG
jgi:sec-independent protein translocase protein TatC